MSRDYFKRLTAKEYTAWDLNCRHVVSHTKARNNTERIIRRQARRRDKMFVKYGVDILSPV